MIKFLVISALLCMSFGLNQTANAGVMLEPFVGYGMGSSKAGSAKYKDSGTVYGARVAYYMAGFFAGGEYQGSSFTFKPTTGSDVTGKGTDIGATVGFEFPILLRVYGTYFVSSQMKTEGSTLKGSGMKVGVGYTAFPLVAFNLEYYSPTYTKSGSDTLTDKLVASEIMLTVSVPFTF